MKSPPESRDPKLYCHFHSDIGHDTKECKSLKRTVDGLAAKGFLQSCISRNTGGSGKLFYKKNKSPPSEEDGNRTDPEFVAVISGGLAAGGPTMRGQKDYVKRLGQVMLSGKAAADPFPKVEIGEADRGKIATPHDDLLVIELKVANLRVRHILVDTGSSAKAVIVTHLMLLKFVCDDGSVSTIHGDQQQVRDCYLTTLSPEAWRSGEEKDTLGNKRKCGDTQSKSLKETLTISAAHMEERRPEPFGAHFNVVSNTDKPDRVVPIEIPPGDPLAADQYPDWVANVVLVKKPNGTWRMCVDYTNLNKACPKDSFPFPKIDRLVDSTAGHAMMSFMDAYSGFHQIPLWLDDQEKTSFFTEKCLYCYKVMPFGLKNAPATFHRLINTLFTKQLGRNIEAYIDDMIGETLYMYLAVSEHSLSTVLLTEREGIQMPMYFVSHVLQNAEIRYPTVENFGLALFMASKKLRPYFLAHRIVVYTGQPLKLPFTKMEASGRMLNWAIELNAFDITYEPRKAVKGQACANFIVEITRHSFDKNTKTVWTLYVDGSSTQNGCGAGITCQSPEGDTFEYAMRFNFQASNNEAEYEALLCGIKMCKAAGAEEILALSDSQLIVSQVNGTYEAREPTMVKYMQAVHQEVEPLKSFEVRQVPRSENNQADALSKLASSASCDTPRHVFWEVKEHKSIEKMEAYSRPLLRCVTPEKGQEILEDLHQGLCSSHIGGRALAEKALRTGNYWPTLKDDAISLVKKCDKCQRFAHLIHRPTRFLTPITSPIPFAKWGMDLLGPFTAAPGGRRYVIVAVDYFTKWVEAEALKNIKSSDFETPKLKEWLADHGIHSCIASVGRPQANGQVEAFNKIISEGIKKKLDEAKGLWADELPNVLWSIRTTAKNSTGETPFLLAYGAEAVLPIEMCEPTLRVMLYDENANWEMMKVALDLLPEVRGNDALRQQLYKIRMAREYNKKVSNRVLKVGDFVLRKMESTGRANEQGKLTPTWEGPYEIYDEVRDGTYRIQDMQGRPILRTWNADNLKKYFF
ncbi:uncharacterized protein [Spinacia oleracea]|uniref:Uncharacterized protein n=1 Tax=Spinacia oleracea TaxID=3562 RepID=A0ABM3RS80_SPIOL|nr:uncharacterized protein LOC130472081 [Spinacia oleracea]